MHFCKIVGVEPTVYSLTGNWPTISLYQPTAMSCLCCSTKFCSAEYNSPRTFCLASYSVLFCDLCPYIATKPRTADNAYKPSTATSRTDTLPFLIPINKLVLLGSQHHLLLFIDFGYPYGPLSQCSFPNTCFVVTSTGLLSERYLAVVSRLVYTNHCWRSCVGLPPLAVSPQLFFVDGKPPTGQ